MCTEPDTAEVSKVAPELTVTLELFAMDPPVNKVNDPWLMIVGDVKELFPDKFSIPVPILVNAPTPDPFMLPLNVRGFVVFMTVSPSVPKFNVPAPPKLLIEVGEVIPETSRVAPELTVTLELFEMAPEPIRATVHPEIVVVPE